MMHMQMSGMKRKRWRSIHTSLIRMHMSNSSNLHMRNSGMSLKHLPG